MSESKAPNFDQWIRNHSGDWPKLEQAVRADIAALEAKHAVELADAVANAIALCHAEERDAIESAAKDVADIEAKMATMVCGTCRGVEFVWSSDVNHHVPCPVCQPKKEG
jgi:hypothetical protein